MINALTCIGLQYKSMDKYYADLLSLVLHTDSNDFPSENLCRFCEAFSFGKSLVSIIITDFEGPPQSP